MSKKIDSILKSSNTTKEGSDKPNKTTEIIPKVEIVEIVKINKRKRKDGDRESETEKLEIRINNKKLKQTVSPALEKIKNMFEQKQNVGQNEKGESEKNEKGKERKKSIKEMISEIES